MNIGLFLPNWLGDLVMATPTLRAVRHRFGRKARLVGILRPNLAELLDGTDWLDEQWYFDPRARQRELRHAALLGRMRRERFDLVIMLTNSIRPAALAWLARAPERIGYVLSGRGPLLTGKVYPRREGGRLAAVAMVEYYLRLAEAVGCPPESRRLELATTEPDRHAVDEIWGRLDLRTDGRVVVLNSSGAYGAAKLWPVEHFGELAKLLVDHTDHDVLVVCGPGERNRARDIARHADRRRVFSLAEQPLGLSISKECIRRCRLMVSTDSGPGHIAAAFGKPVVTLFGPTQPTWIENPTVRAVNLQHDLECIGCRRRVCPLGHHRCMRELSPGTVYMRVAKLLEEESPSRAA